MCLILCDPMDCSLVFLGPWDFTGMNTGVVGTSYSRGSSWPRDWTCFSCISCICRQIFLPLAPPGKPHFVSVVQSLSCVQLFETPWTAARQTTLSFTISWSLLKLMSIESVMPFNHLILCQPLLLWLPVFPSTRVFSMSQLCASESQHIGTLASASVLLVNIQDLFPLGWLVLSPCSLRDSQEPSPTLQLKSISSLVLSLLYGPTHTSIQEKP